MTHVTYAIILLTVAETPHSHTVKQVLSKQAETQ